jgi:hypothetical protein
MQLMRSAPRAKLLQFQPRRIIAPVFLTCVVALSALDALQRDHDPIRFALLRHARLSSTSAALNDPRSGRTSFDDFSAERSSYHFPVTP